MQDYIVNFWQNGCVMASMNLEAESACIALEVALIDNSLAPSMYKAEVIAVSGNYTINFDVTT